ncbi:murein hydrolase activator EnvC family protein [Pseudanabaena sp. PCC 6802]|uniref:murein hydrolase activator EnvC family protein n=1 Tax=Pseudanabaena sp. PCC 6802 TaxID=118173 RepID=UPI00034D46BC|nr:peptidoglycan DD-metalloendopeptidase family protein [Pseudanabaena sp. PCC 6802]
MNKLRSRTLKLPGRVYTSLKLCLWGCLLVAIALLMPIQLVQAQSVKDLQNYQQQVEQQKQILQKQQEQIKNLAKPAQDRLDALRQNVVITEAQIQQNTLRLEKAEAAFKQSQANLQKFEFALKQKRVATATRLRYLQRQQDGRWWVLLLGSRDLQQFSDRRRQLSRIYQSDRALLASLKGNTDKIEEQYNRIAAQKNDIALLNQKLAYQKANLEAEATAQNYIVDRLKSDRRALEAAEERLTRDSQQITSLILAKTQPAPGIVIIPGTGQMMYPTVGPITSPFGWRMHPILGYEKFHAGMDFGAEYGSIIYAADSGTVIFAGWYGGYGNAVIIDHGNRITTLYGHASELYVREGQSVQKGQPIAAVGSTGFSTGPHLHFEVRSNGEPTDPAPFL